MPIVVTRNWSNTQFSVRGGQIEAVESYVVTGVKDKPSAQLAITSPTTNAPIQRGDPYPDPIAGYLTVASIGANQIAPLAFRVDVVFNLNNNIPMPTDRLLLPMEINIEPMSTSAPSDRDVTGAIVWNTAKDVFTDGIPLFKHGATFEARWYAPMFLAGAMLNYQDAVNSDVLQLPGLGSIPIGNAFCRFYGLAQPVRSTDKWVAMRVEIDVREGNQPWQPRITDKGRYGWYTPSGGGPNQKGPICVKGGDLADQDVLLDGTGKPIGREWYIWNGTQAQTPVSSDLDDPPIDEDLSTDAVTVLIYQQYRAVSFAKILRGS